MALFHVQPDFELWLASGSPRRKALLASLGLAPQIIIPDNAEPAPSADEEAESYARRAAAAKADWATARISSPKAIVIAADTIVCANGAILGKPVDYAQAVAMLTALNGKWHAVFTAVDIRIGPGRKLSFCEKTEVRFADWPLAALESYAQSGEPLDKAGAYSIQDQGAFLTDAVHGSWTNVAGLPLAKVAQCLLAEGVIGA